MILLISYTFPFLYLFFSNPFPFLTSSYFTVLFILPFKLLYSVTIYSIGSFNELLCISTLLYPLLCYYCAIYYAYYYAILLILLLLVFLLGFEVFIYFSLLH